MNPFCGVEMKLKSKFNIKMLLSSFIASFGFSSWIFFELLHIKFSFLVLIFGFFSFYKILLFSKKELFLTGFFIGIIWFYWIGLSFRYVGLTQIVPIIIIGIGIIYGAIFYLLGFVKNFILRAFVMLFYFDIVTPFGFEWLKPEIILLNANLGGRNDGL
jgi:apolipoprotein N-acyltransferase